MSGDLSHISQIWTSAEPNELLAPLQWLIGTWKSVSAEGTYPSVAPFTYCEEISFASYGQPLLNYNAVAWHPVKKSPMHLESGFLRIQPEICLDTMLMYNFTGTKQLAFMVAHNFGLTSLEEGSLTSEKTIDLSSQQISRMSFAKDPEVLAIKRTFELESGKLIQTVYMKTSKTDMCQHLRVVYEKI